ncbi:hypothetical protein GH733_006030 [Mirounga leonina]|nr:hypothetical protein GH733_006030 [Mirounga leonina]
MTALQTLGTDRTLGGGGGRKVAILGMIEPGHPCYPCEMDQWQGLNLTFAFDRPLAMNQTQRYVLFILNSTQLTKRSIHTQAVKTL